jgi:DMSO/TMAO reductase YedYZ molybdopterin-dependent catalytic subunit
MAMRFGPRLRLRDIARVDRLPLSFILDRVGALPQVRYVVYRSFQPDWWESVDMADALHPQTIVAHGMNGAEPPVPFGGPLRLRLPRQLGYKSVNYINPLTPHQQPQILW